jgi:hypothetical protein
MSMLPTGTCQWHVPPCLVIPLAHVNVNKQQPCSSSFSEHEGTGTDGGGVEDLLSIGRRIRWDPRPSAESIPTTTAVNTLFRLPRLTSLIAHPTKKLGSVISVTRTNSVILNFSSKLFIQVSCMFFGVVHVAGLLNLLQPICQVFVVALVVVQVSHLLLLVALLLLLPCAGAPVDGVRNISEVH